MRDHRLSARSARLGLLPRHALGGKRCLERVDLVSERLGHRHGPDYLMQATLCAASAHG